jgi:glycosyltransferase involved in cell wall biosynthesis
MTSHVEGFPMVLVEAMSLGLPLVAFDCPRGPAEIIEPGRTGLLVPDGDEPAFTRAIRSVVTDAEARRRMGAAGWHRAGAYELPRVAGLWEALLDDVARRHHPREGPATAAGGPLRGRPLHPEPSRH